MTDAVQTVRRAPGSVPLLGNILPLLRNPLRYLGSLPAHGDLVELRLGPVRVLMVCDPELTRQVLVDDRLFDKGGPLSDRAAEFLGNGLATCPHREHRRQRRLLQPAFSPARLPHYAQLMTTQIAAALDAWHDGQTIEVYPGMYALAADIAVATLFADTATAALRAEVCAVFGEVSRGSYRRLLSPPPVDRLPTPGNRRYHRAAARLRQLTADLIAAHREAGQDRQDLLSTLLAARDADGEPLSEQEISDQVVILLFAGIDTVASTMSWALGVLAQRPDVQRRLRAEVGPVLAGRAATWADLPRLAYTRAVVSETLRLYPPGWVLNRATSADTVLGGYRVPAGTALIFSPYLLARRPDRFPEPERFDPDRWLDGSAGRVGQDAFVPFGGGARKCIGDRFAMTEATLALASIVSRWRLHPVPGRRRAPAVGLTMAPPPHLRVRLSGCVDDEP